MPTLIRLAISTCPNDTFAFHALLNDEVDTGDLQFEIELLDISELNAGLSAGRFDVAKASFHAAVLSADNTVVLPVGSALGFGVGPLLLADRPNKVPQDARQVVLCPGEHTTATLLFRLFYPQTASIQHTVFSQIMPMLQQHDADFGVCIHEGRFTWQQQGLSLVADLGEQWEKATGAPLPLGGILARRTLGPAVTAEVTRIIRDSLQHALDDPESALPTMRRYAQEFDDHILMKHVELYVNDWTRDLGTTGRRALQELSERARSAGVTPEHNVPIEVLQPV